MFGSKRGHPDWKPEKRIKKSPKPLSRIRKNTGELALFLKIYAQLKGKCEVTGKTLKFDVKHFAHLLSKGARPDLRLNRMNIIHCEFDFHYLLDNSTKENVLKSYPNVEWIFDLKQKLKQTPVIK